MSAQLAIPPSQQKSPSISLKLLRQPEEHHRARYLSEGSRGTIKGRHGRGYCTVQLSGYHRPTRLEVYAGTGAGKLEPHRLYRLSAVPGKGSPTTPCEEVTAGDGLNCLLFTLRPDSKMTAVLDCAGILKLCDEGSRRRFPKTQKVTSVRLVFRAFVPDEVTGSETIIQTLSEPVSCGQEMGTPSVKRMSLSSDHLCGGSQLFIIGKNFDKTTKVVFREWGEDGSLVWSSEAPIDSATFHQCHLICEVPAYKSLSSERDVDVSLTLECGHKASQPTTFTFFPNSGVKRKRELLEEDRKKGAMPIGQMGVDMELPAQWSHHPSTVQSRDNASAAGWSESGSRGSNLESESSFGYTTDSQSLLDQPFAWPGSFPSCSYGREIPQGEDREATFTTLNTPQPCARPTPPPFDESPSNQWLPHLMP